MDKGARIYVAGHSGLVGSAIVRRLEKVDCEVITAGRDKVDLLDSLATDRFLALTKPDVVVVAAAKVGGIHANNTYRAEFIYDNLCIQNNVIENAYRQGVKKLLLLAFAAFALITSATGCRTAHGAGEDMQRAGEKIQDKTDR